MKRAYLDWNAAAPLHEVLRQNGEWLPVVAGNPSSVHSSGRAARAALEHARESIAKLVGMPRARVIFTSGGTEANNLALAGFALKGDAPFKRFVSAIEHDSLRMCAVDYTEIPVTAQGIVDTEKLCSSLEQDSVPALVSVMAANNETGILQPARAIGALIRAKQGFFHCDATQLVGRLDMEEFFAGDFPDLMTLSAHKLGGLSGIGALVLHSEFADRGGIIHACMQGGGQEQGLRAGTENRAGITSFGRIAEILGPKAHWKEQEARRLWLETEARRLQKQALLVGADSARLPNTVCLILPGVSSELQLIRFDLAGVEVGAGSACSSGKLEASHVLLAMGHSLEEARSAIRVSFGPSTTDSDLQAFLKAWEGMPCH